MVNRIMNFLRTQHIVKEEDVELVEFGLRQGIYYIINIAVTLALGVLFREPLAAVFFLLCYIPIRSYAGGYHAKTVLRCFVMSVFIVAAVLGSIHFYAYPLLLGILLLGISVLGLWRICPVDNRKRRLDALEMSVYRRRSHCIILAELFIAAICAYFRWENLFETVVMAVAVTFVLAVIEKSFHGDRKKD